MTSASRRPAKRAKHSHSAPPATEEEYTASGAYLGTYARKAHVSERLAAALCLEPEIAREHMNVVMREFQLLERAKHQDYATYLRVGQHLMPGDVPLGRATRAAISETLRSLDKKRMNGRRNWTNKYLERWRSIRAHMCALRGPAAAAFSFADAHRVGALFSRLSDVWNTWNPPDLRPFAERHYKFPERAHFPNYNATFISIFKALAIPYDHDEWPMPCSERAVRAINVYLSALFDAVGIPFESFAVSTPRAEMQES